MSDKRPQTIQFFLPQGKPRGIRITVITTRIVQAVLVHRTKLADAEASPELRNVGVYFLFGQPEDAAMPTVYIGEAEDCFTWFKQHKVNKDFWQHAERRGQMVEDGFTVLPGSRARKELVPSAGEWVRNNRKELLEQGILKEDGDQLLFVEPYTFNTPSGAAIAVLGRNANGWQEWKTKFGSTLDEVKRQPTDSEDETPNESGGRHLPGLVLHDSPREADIENALYHRLFDLAGHLENIFDGAAPSFQYIVTTTTPPPDELDRDPYVRLRLDARQDDGLLLRRRLSIR